LFRCKLLVAKEQHLMLVACHWPRTGFLVYWSSFFISQASYKNILFSFNCFYSHKSTPSLSASFISSEWSCVLSFFLSMQVFHSSVSFSWCIFGATVYSSRPHLDTQCELKFTLETEHTVKKKRITGNRHPSVPSTRPCQTKNAFSSPASLA